VLARARPWRPRGAALSTWASASPTSPTLTTIVAAAQKALADGHHGHTPANGFVQLCEAVSEDMAARGAGSRWRPAG
jgi:aspartate aminotransferase